MHTTDEKFKVGQLCFSCFGLKFGKYSIKLIIDHPRCLASQSHQLLKQTEDINIHVKGFCDIRFAHCNKTVNIFVERVAKNGHFCNYMNISIY